MYLALKIGTVSVTDYFSTVLVDSVIERSHDSVVNTVTRLGLHDQGYGLQPGQETFSSPKHPDQVCGPILPLFQWVPGFFARNKAARA
jgi:hypothetical protein